jgi:hypothetical protein
MYDDAEDDRQVVDEVRAEARLAALHAIARLEEVIRADEGSGGIDAIRIGCFWKEVRDKVRLYGMTVSVGDWTERESGR